MLNACLTSLRRFFARFGSRGGTLLFTKTDIEVYINSSTILGEGGFSSVFKATDVTKRTHYALKKVIVQPSDECTQRSIFAELKSYKLFRHPNISTLIDSISQENDKGHITYYLLMPLMKHGTLRQELNNGMKSDPQRLQKDIALVLKDFQKICSAFNYMHTLSPVKFIHQDIKPENILIADDGEPMLTDFGSVREAEISIDKRSKALAVSEEAAIFCTMPYRAIELFDPHTGTQLDSRTDVWGIGCLLFSWWFGYSPFECEFTPTGAVKVVECSLSRILAKIPRPTAARASENDIFVADLVEWILVHDMKCRPFCAKILERLDRTSVTANRATTAMVPV